MTFLLHYFPLKHLYRRVNKLRLGMYKIFEKQRKSIPDTTKPEKCSSAADESTGRSNRDEVCLGPCHRAPAPALAPATHCVPPPASHCAARHNTQQLGTDDDGGRRSPAVSSLDRVLAGGQLAAESKFQLRCNFNFGNFLQKRPTWITFKTKGRTV